MLVDAVAECVQQGYDLRLKIVGGGKHKSELMDRARKHGLGERVIFTGEIPSGDPVRLSLDEADLFILPSRTEGMPRAMIEAMARGLPCIGTTVGGIPELLEREDMVALNNAAALAQKIREVVADPNRMELMSKRNLAKAQEFREEILRERRIKFYNYIELMTDEWQRTGIHPCTRMSRVCAMRVRF
jgi:glycosyltransferase involved in cell wall biosynthesis